ncbi:hypothetical protein [Burkholderia pseudomallei]|uniref:hypothetical protein n=1 Tax=Burkholderia pseudomallei TaxID=28450 RepID=UPI00294A646E|nr:hypothetical protein [Burkholderia pseudomallei]CAJ9866677.1 putative bacteriophage protein gp82 [Burkholderia pseudomallei]
MARRPMKPCKHRGCGALVADGKSHCDQHAHEAVKWKSDAVRGNRHARGYGDQIYDIVAVLPNRAKGYLDLPVKVGEKYV